MSVINKAVNGFFTFNNKQYRLPNIQTNNRKNFDVMKVIMNQYTYNEFAKNFDHIYNNSDDYSKVMCCYMREICEQYDTLKKNDPTSGFKSIICTIKLNAEDDFRPNNRHFHLNYINFVIYWKYYKISYGNCNTIRLFNSLLKDLKLPNDLRSGFPDIVKKTFDEGLKAVIDKVKNAHESYWKLKNEKALNELDKKFKVEFKEKLNEYESYFNTIREECVYYVDCDILEILFGFDDDLDNDNFRNKFRLYITNNLLKSLIEKGNYKELKDKYEYIKLDSMTKKLSKYVYNEFGLYVIRLKDKVTPKQVSGYIEDEVKKICGNHDYKPKSEFKSNEHKELIMNLLQ